MKKKIKNFIKALLKIVRLQPIPKEKYEFLKKIDRYQEVVVKLLGNKFKIADSMSFFYNYKEIFIENIYKFKTKNNSPIILDCGSNYGTSIIYFKTLYPQAKIIGIEADPYIFSLLQWNLEQRNYKDITLINKAISNSTHPIYFYSEGADGGRTFPIEENNKKLKVAPIALDDLIQEPIDFLKMDIEGAETEVICSSKKLHNVNQLFIEYHSFKDSDQTLSDLLNVLSKNGFRYYIHTQFCSPQPLIEEQFNLGLDLQLNIFARKN